MSSLCGHRKLDSFNFPSEEVYSERGQPQPAVQVELGQEDEGERGPVAVRQVDDPAVDGDDLAAVGDVRGEVGGEEGGQVGASVVNKAKILEKDRRKF